MISHVVRQARRTHKVRLILEWLAWAQVFMSGALGATAVVKPDFKPSFNFYSPQQDVQLGRESSAQVENQLPLLEDAEVLVYLDTLGKRLVAFAPNNQAEYAWQFRIVNSAEINAFALPGGYVYLNRGVFDAAENESQLAGVIAHETGHVVMRHGTHTASEAILAQGGMAILTGMLGQSDSLSSQLAQLGLGLGVDSLLLKNSRAAETQADEVGAYILYQASYDPHAMARFFEIITRKYPQRTVQFFSDHPSPENRSKLVDAEIAEWGSPRTAKIDDLEFEGVKQRLAAIDLAPSQKVKSRIDAKLQPPPLPSVNLARYDSKIFALDYPDNWQSQQGEDSVTFFPAGGMVTGADGETLQAYGMAVSLYRPQQANWGLVDATQEVLDTMRRANPQMRVLHQAGLSLCGNPAISTLLQSDSPIEGQRESDHLVTVRRGDSLLTFIFIAPSDALPSYAPAFDKILQTVDLTAVKFH